MPLLPIFAAALLTSPQADEPFTPQSAAVACAFPGTGPQPASATDMTSLMQRYIGKFRSPAKRFDNSDKEYHFTIEYDWFDRAKSIARFRVDMVIPADNRVIPNAEGFYGHDPAAGNLYVFGVFANGTTGRGTMGRFDLATGARTVWARSADPQGIVTHVQDGFEIVDGDSFRNRTLVCRSDKGEWQEVGGDVYTRVSES